MKQALFFCFWMMLVPLLSQTESDFLTQHRSKLKFYQTKLEQLRQRVFKKEIAVGVQTKEVFRAYLNTFLEKEISPERNRFLSQTFQWLTLGDARFDYRQKLLEVFENEAVAYYDIYSQSFFFLQKEIADDQIAPVIIHELQHGLQDQYYPLEKYFQIALQSESEDLLIALRFLIEGEASLLMNWFSLKEQYPHHDSQKIPELLHHLLSLEIDGNNESSHQSTLKIQDYFMATLSAPYFQGMYALSHAYQKGQWERIDQLFSSPPTTTEQMLHFPQKYLKERDHPTRITWNLHTVCDALNQALPLEKKLSPFKAGQKTTFGEFGLYSVFHHLLKNRNEAKKISEGWDGDLFQSFVQEKESAFFWILTFDQDSEAEEALEGFLKILPQWKGSSSLALQVSRQQKEIILTAITPELTDLFHQQITAHFQTTEDRRIFHLMNQSCPHCYSIRIVPIIYGMPGPELVEQAKQGDIFLGGCCPSEAHYHCRDCATQW